MSDKNEKIEDAMPEGKKEEVMPEDITTEPTAEEHAEEHAEPDNGKSHRESHKHKKDKASEKVAELEGVIAGMMDKHLRLQAEFDNFRKRTLREKADLIKSGGETVLTAILPIIDDIERALGSLKEVADDDPSKIGFVLIYNKFQEFLKNNSIREIDATGKEFDVDLHFAVTKIPAPSEDLRGRIVDVVQKGYTLNEKVIRFAKVVIGE